MVLDFGDDIQTLFKHSKEFDQGVGTRQERKGQATVIVSLDGTGDTDDIQSAINMLPSTGGVIFIKEGEYNPISTIIINKSNVKLEGTGNGTLIKCSSSVVNYVFYASGVNNINISYIRFDGTNKNNIPSIQLTNVSNSLITFCSFQNISSNYGIYMDSCDSIRITGNDLGTTIGIFLTNTNNIQISGNIGSTSTAMIIDSGNYNIISYNKFNEMQIVNGDSNSWIGNKVLNANSLDNTGTNTQIAHNITS